jgi:hypothetical protein
MVIGDIKMFHSQAFQKFTKIVFFCMKIYNHLATLTRATLQKISKQKKTSNAWKKCFVTFKVALAGVHTKTSTHGVPASACLAVADVPVAASEAHS